MLTDSYELGAHGLYVRRAEGAQDVSAVADILTNAGTVVAAQGYETWTLPYSPQAAAKQVAEGYTFMVIDPGDGRRTIGTFILQWEDARMWGPQPADAGYVHALALRPEYKGHKVGQAILTWIGRAIAAEGREYARLDCPRSNTKLQCVYEGQGFQSKGNVDVLGHRPYHAVLLEKPLINQSA